MNLVQVLICSEKGKAYSLEKEKIRTFPADGTQFSPACPEPDIWGREGHSRLKLSVALSGMNRSLNEA
jgi:hypothetical protein